jgi:hypothetical protein
MRSELHLTPSHIADLLNYLLWSRKDVRLAWQGKRRRPKIEPWAVQALTQIEQCQLQRWIEQELWLSGIKIRINFPYRAHLRPVTLQRFERILTPKEKRNA